MNATNSSAPENTGAPANAQRVLITLIIVAAVANLPLSMANVALPSIGKYFDASQVQLNLVAVAYSLGLACSVLWLGALGDRYGRKMMAIIGVSLAIPAALHQRLCPNDQYPVLWASVWRLCRRHGLPNHPGFDRGPVGAGTCPDALDRHVGGSRRRDLGLGSAARRHSVARSPPGRGFSSSSSRWRWWRLSWHCATFRRTSTRPPKRWTTWAAFSRWSWWERLCSRSTSCRLPNTGPPRWGFCWSPWSSQCCLSSASVGRRTRCMTSRSPHGPPSGWRPSPASSSSAH